MVDRTDGLLYETGQGYSQLDAQSARDRLDGYAVVSGLDVTPGGSLSVDVAPGEAIVGTDTNGDTITVSPGATQNVSLAAADSANPRKDTVWIDDTGTAQVTTGTPETALPEGNNRFNTFQPEPPFPAGDGTILAEVYVEAGATSLTTADIRDRRQPAQIVGEDAQVASVTGASGTGVYDDATQTFGDGTTSADHESVSTLESRTAPRIITVDVPTDFASVAAAIDEIDSIRASPGLKFLVNIETGHEWQQQVTVEDTDLRHVTITSEDATVSFSNTGISYAIEGVNAVMPVWDTIYDGHGNDFGVRATDGSVLSITNNGGVRNTTEAISAVTGGIVYAQGAEATGSDRGFNAVDSGRIDAKDVDISGNNVYGVRAASNSNINLRGATATNIGSAETDAAVRASDGSFVTAVNSDLSGSANAVSSSESIVVARGATTGSHAFETVKNGSFLVSINDVNYGKFRLEELIQSDYSARQVANINIAHNGTETLIDSVGSAESGTIEYIIVDTGATARYRYGRLYYYSGADDTTEETILSANSPVTISADTSGGSVDVTLGGDGATTNDYTTNFIIDRAQASGGIF